MICPENLQQLRLRWQELPSSNEGEKRKKIICVDRKIMRSSKKNSSRPCYIVLAWSREDGYFLRQKAMWQKQVGHVNPEYTGKHRDKMADHDHRCHWDTDNGCEDNTEETSRLCAAVKGNHKNLETDMCLYFKNL